MVQKFPIGGICHISGRPYNVYRWKAGSDARYKKTVICREVAKAKHVCQVCMLDLDYNLPVQVRDHAMGIQENLPLSDAGKEFALSNMESSSELDSKIKRYGESSSNYILTKLARNEPYYRRNQARICSFFVKGSCNRDIECPFRHETPTGYELTRQNYHDRYYGTNDPVAKKMLARAANTPTLNHPKDLSITTLFIGNISSVIKQADLREIFCTYGEIEFIKIQYLQNCALVKYKSRRSAEIATSTLNRQLVVKGIHLNLRWGKPLNKSFSEKLNGNLYESMDPDQFGTMIGKPINVGKSNTKMEGHLSPLSLQKVSKIEPKKNSGARPSAVSSNYHLKTVYDAEMRT
jgi:pre-mRNA-splicing factor RBM22/SLT11